MVISMVNPAEPPLKTMRSSLFSNRRQPVPTRRSGSGAGDGLFPPTPVGIDQAGGKQGCRGIAAVCKRDRSDDASIILVARYVGERNNGGSVSTGRSGWTAPVPRRYGLLSSATSVPARRCRAAVHRSLHDGRARAWRSPAPCPRRSHGSVPPRPDRRSFRRPPHSRRPGSCPKGQAGHRSWNGSDDRA